MAKTQFTYGKIICLFVAGSKLVHLVPLMFAGMTFTIFDAVANINNNINSNNNNNNIQNINFQQSVNTGLILNIMLKRLKNVISRDLSLIQ